MACFNIRRDRAVYVISKRTIGAGIKNSWKEMIEHSPQQALNRMTMIFYGNEFYYDHIANYCFLIWI